MCEHFLKSFFIYAAPDITVFVLFAWFLFSLPSWFPGK